MNRFDWPALIQVGLGSLGLQPQAFWALTPGELALMLGPAGGDAPLDRAGLAALSLAHPDAKRSE